MKYAYDDSGDPIPEKVAIATVRSAAMRVKGLFRREAFDLDDLTQQALAHLIPLCPFAHQKVLYVAAYRALLSYRMHVGGTKTKDRGGRRSVMLGALEDDPYSVSREHPPEYFTEIRDQIEWAYARLDLIDQKIVEAYAVKEGAVTKLAEELGLTPASLYHRHNEIMERMNDASKDKKRNPHHRPNIQSRGSVSPDRNEVDRQRAIKRLADTR